MSKSSQNSVIDFVKDYLTTLATSPTGSNSLQLAKSKRLRTSFQYFQLNALRNFFTSNQNPNSEEVYKLALTTGLDRRVVQVKFISHLLTLNKTFF